MKIVVFILTLIVFNACTVDEQYGEIEQKKLTLDFSSFINDNQSEMVTLSKLDVFLFTNGIFTTHYDNILLDSDNTLSLELSNTDKSKLYFLADPANMVDLAHLVLNTSSETDFLNSVTKSTIAIGEIEPFFTGVKDLTNTSDPTFTVEMVRAVARLGLEIVSTATIAVESIELKNLNTSSFIYKKTPTTYPIHSTSNLTKTYQPALSTNTENICYLVEQENSNSTIEIRVLINGIRNIITTKLPPLIKRNVIYNIRLLGVGASLSATINVHDWEDGDNVDASPDISHKSIINLATSTIPLYIRVSKTLDTLFVPSCDATFTVNIASNTTIDTHLEGEGISVTKDAAVSGMFNIITVMKNSNSPKSFAYLNIKNSSASNYDGSRIVFVLEESKTKFSGLMNENIVDGKRIVFSEYIDGILGSILVPKSSSVEYEGGLIPQWIRFESQDSGGILATGGFKPNDMVTNGNIEKVAFKVRHSTGEAETYEISRVRNSLPVVNINGTHWCKYNLRGNGLIFAEQILNDTPSLELLEYLKTCSNERFVELQGDGYKRTHTNGLKLKLVEVNETTKSFRYENYASINSGDHVGTAPICPSGYRIPSFDETKKIFANYTVSTNVNPISWTNPDGDAMSITIHIRENVLHDGGNLGSINLYSITGDEAGEQLIISGLGHQWDNTGFTTETSLLTYGTYASAGNVWNIWNSKFENRFGGHNSNKTRIVRCIKTPGYFVY